jgi:hypothetical protein
VEDHYLHAILVTRWGRRQKKGEGVPIRCGSGKAEREKGEREGGPPGEKKRGQREER